MSLNNLHTRVRILNFTLLICVSRVFFFHYYLAISMTINIKFSQVYYFVHNYVEILQVRRLVFDNYQLCPVSLTLDGGNRDSCLNAHMKR